MQSLTVPAGPLQNGGGQSFDGPVYDLAVVVLHVEKNLAVGVGPVEFRHRSLEGDGMLHVVIGAAMVCEDRNAEKQKSCHQTQAFCQRNLQRSTSQRFSKPDTRRV